MKLVSAENNRFVFHLGKREKQLLLAVLGFYPVIPTADQPLSKSGTSDQTEVDRRLLEEALAEQREENKRQLERLLGDPQRWQDTETGCDFTLTSSEIEWFLQVLNDIRVGSWIQLGSPEKEPLDFELNETTAPHIWTMEAAGAFQMNLLKAVRHDGAT